MGGEGETLMFSKFSVFSFVLLAEYTMMGAGIVISNKSKKIQHQGAKVHQQHHACKLHLHSQGLVKMLRVQSSAGC